MLNGVVFEFFFFAIKTTVLKLKWSCPFCSEPIGISFRLMHVINYTVSVHNYIQFSDEK